MNENDLWFAWYPVKLDDGNFAWLKNVKYRKNFIFRIKQDLYDPYTCEEPEIYYSYRLP